MENSVPILVALLVGVAIGYFICKKISDGNNNGNPNAKAPDGIIEVTDAVNLHENYVEKLNASTTGTKAPDFKETQFVWFSMEKIRNYINYLDNIERVNPNNSKISGIRVYFGKYNQHIEYPNQQTVFFTPTIDTNLVEDYRNMKNLPFYIIPKDASSAIVGKYKIIGDLLLDIHDPYKRANKVNSSLGHKPTENVSQKSTTENDDDTENGDDGTGLCFNIGELSPPPPKK